MGRKKSIVAATEESLKESSKKQAKARKLNKGLDKAEGEELVVVAPAEEAEDRSQKYCKWATTNGTDFTPAGATTDTLSPGLYEINLNDQIGIYFTRLNISCEGILRLPDGRTEEIVKDITTFWERESIFKDYGLAHKRGALLFGSPGTSKSCTIRLIIADVVKRGGIALNFGEPGLFGKGLRILRDIQPDTPIVCILEDIDTLIETYDESAVINILDGVSRIEKVVFLASTNYVERLGARLCNRPSRFDKRYAFDFPSADARKMYFQHLFNKNDALEYDIEEWVKDTEGMSLAHLKELFTNTVILGNPYEEAIETLKAMGEDVSSGDTSGGKGLGFDTER